MKRIIALITLVVAVAVYIAAATDYGFYVGGVRVTSNNCNNITGDHITAYSPSQSYSAVYNPSTKTLTLTNVSIERTGSYNRALYNDTCRGLKVVFVKANRMEASDSSPLRFNAATTMTSPNGNVSVSGGSEDAITVGNGATLTITDALVRVYSDSHGIIGDTGNESLIVEESNISTYCQKKNYNALRNFKSLSVTSSRIELKTKDLTTAVVNLKAFSMSGDRMCTLLQTFDAQKQTFVYGSMPVFYGYIAPAVAFDDRSVFPDENFANRLSPYTTEIYDDYLLQYIVLPSKHHAGTAGGRWKILGPLPKNIASLKGIEYITDLEELYCDSLQLTSLDLTANTKLKTLWCSNNKLTSLKLPNNNLLTTLYCHHNRLTSLDLSKCTMLKDLRCNSNPLTALNLTATSGYLTTLHCDNCNLSTLDVSQHIVLSTLLCNNNRLQSINMPSSETYLQYMDCSNNQLTALNVLGVKRLKELNCANNQITELDIRNLSQVNKLLCQNNRITSLNLTKATELVDFDCSNNQLTTLNFTWCTNLSNTVNCFGNQITGDGMTQLVESLPNSPYYSNLNFVNHHDPNEGNSVRALQLSTAKTKRWNICHLMPNADEYSAIELECQPVDLKIANHAISSCYCGYNGKRNIAELFDDMSGTVQYYPDGNKLTLNNATITHSLSGIFSGPSLNVLSIILEGTNTLNINSLGSAIYLSSIANHYINGTGTLNINAPYGATAIHLKGSTSYAYHMLHIEDCTLNVNGNSFITGEDGDNDLTISNATVRMSDGRITVGNELKLVDCYISKPAGGHVVGGYLCAAGSNNYFTGEIEILPGSDVLKGDVNGDGRVNVSDVTALINMILGMTTMDEARADVNGDGRVNVSDVTALINIILGIS